MVALAASSDHVRPIFAPFFTGRNDVIESEFFGAEFRSAVLATIVIAAVNIFSTEFHTGEAAVIDEALEAQNRRDWEVLARRSGDRGMIFENFDFTLEPEQERSLPAHKFYGLIARIQNQSSDVSERIVPYRLMTRIEDLTPS